MPGAPLADSRALIVERCLTDDQQRKLIRETRVRGLRRGPFIADIAAGCRCESREPRGYAEERAEPVRGLFARVERIDGVAPDGRANRLRIGERFGAQGRAQGRHAGRVDDEIIGIERGADQRHARMRALREHGAGGVDHHPVAVVFEAGLEERRAAQ